MRKFYNKKIVWSGNIVEVYEYDNSLVCGEVRNENGRAGMTVSDSSDSDRSKLYRYQVLTKARRDVRRLINANVDKWGEKPKFVTLTFAENVQDIKQANYEFKKFRQRLEYGLELKLKYVCVIEFQKRGAIHYHVVFFNLPYVEFNYLSDIWRNGFIKINAIEQVDNVGAYVTKYMTKENDDERLRGEKSYFTSRGLFKPIEKHLNEKEIAKVKDKLSHKKVYENQFKNEYTGNILYTQYNLKK